MMNEDLKRFYSDNQNKNDAHNFVRLDNHVKVPAAVLPSYADDVIEL